MSKLINALSAYEQQEADLYLRGGKRFADLMPVTQKIITASYQAMKIAREGGRKEDMPFSPKLDEDEVIDRVGADADAVKQGYDRIFTNEVTESLMARTGTDADRPEDTSPPTISELLEAAYDTIEGVAK